MAGRSRKRKRGAEEVVSQYEVILNKVKPERLLRVKRVKPNTVIAYNQHVQRFLTWVNARRLNVTVDSKVDRAMAIYLNMLYEDGEALNTASYTLFGFIALKMIPKGPERDLLPLSRSALTAWRGTRVVKARVGSPPQVIYAFAKFCCECDCVEAAAASLIQYDLYARPSEVLGLRGRDLVPPVPGLSQHWGVIFGNADFGERCKTGDTDDIVFADSKHRSFAGTLLKFLGRKFLSRDVALFDLTLAQYEDLCRKFSRKFKLSAGFFTPHCLRHSGPSYDAIHQLRCLAAIQARGRWACAASVNRYKKPGRLLLEASKLPSALKQVQSHVLQDTLACILSHSWNR